MNNVLRLWKLTVFLIPALKKLGYICTRDKILVWEACGGRKYEDSGAVSVYEWKDRDPDKFYPYPTNVDWFGAHHKLNGQMEVW